MLFIALLNTPVMPVGTLTRLTWSYSVFRGQDVCK